MPEDAGSIPATSTKGSLMRTLVHDSWPACGPGTGISGIEFFDPVCDLGRTIVQL
jgi:hypothetical protein